MKIMTNLECADILKKGVNHWNKWRKENPQVSPSLRQLNFHEKFSNKDEVYEIPSFQEVNLSDVDLHMAILRNGWYHYCCFDNAKMSFTDLVDTWFDSCSFKNVNFRVAKLGNAQFHDCIFENADLSYCTAEDTDFSGSKFINCKLNHMSLVSTNFTNTQIINSSVYGISSWDLSLNGSVQKDLIITKEDEPIITIDDIELAQFVYLLINNSKMRNAIDTITSKVVLILGNFSPERKKVLDDIREKLRYYNLIPIQYDFTKPSFRDHTETVQTIANMSKFIIADLSNPRSIPQELTAIIPHLPSTNIYPIILENEKEYGMFEHLQRYPWVKPIITYLPNDIDNILNAIVNEQNEV